MKNSNLFILIVLSSLLLSGCTTSTESEEPESVFPMYVDDNENGINDFVEQGTHETGLDNIAVTTGEFSGGSEGSGHSFIDSDGDGICDYAQDGSPSWHGPGFVDRNQNGMSDHW